MLLVFHQVLKFTSYITFAIRTTALIASVIASTVDSYCCFTKLLDTYSMLSVSFVPRKVNIEQLPIILSQVFSYIALSCDKPWRTIQSLMLYLRTTANVSEKFGILPILANSSSSQETNKGNLLLYFKLAIYIKRSKAVYRRYLLKPCMFDELQE